MNTVYFFAGESSGDLHGSFLIESLKTLDPTLNLIGVGGQKMREKGLQGSIPMESFQVMGISEMIKNFPRLAFLFYKVRHEILTKNPKILILIDSPVFNLRLAKSLRKKGYRGKIIQYVCPTVWAHGKGRMKILTDYFDLLLTTFPFEKEIFRDSPLRVEYAGHPLVKTLQDYPYQKEWFKTLGMKETSSLIALFPGSRMGEIVRHAPQQLKTAEALLKKHPDLQFALSCSHENLYSKLFEFAKASSLQLGKNLFIVPPKFQYELMRDASLAMAKSGTVTLELALHQVPTVVHYDLTFINYLFVKLILRLKLSHYCIVNILMNETIFPELYDYKTPQDHFDQTMCDLYENSETQKQIRSKCLLLKQSLIDALSHEQIAKICLET